MKVIFTQNIKGIGRIGDIKNVSDGYAKNFLLPKNLAKPANEQTLREAEKLKIKAQSDAKIKKEEAQKIAERLKDMTIEFSRKLSKTGTLFASITDIEIAKALSEKVGAKIEADMVNLNGHQNHIKRSGGHVVPIELSDDISANVNVVVVEEKEEKK